MKPIVIATDFSKTARNAAEHAAKLAKDLSSELILAHVWSLPVMTGETVAFPYSIDEMEESNMKRVNAEAKFIREKWNVPVKAVARLGFFNDEMNQLCKDENAAMVVMGMGHRKGEHFFGSTTTLFTRHTQFPVLIIPEDADYHKIKKILLATDLVTSHRWQELNALKELGQALKASVHLIYVSEDLESAAMHHKKDGVRIEKVLSAGADQWHFESGEVVTAVSEEAEKLHADLIAVVHHQLPWYKKIFHLSTTKELSFATHLPLMVFPEHNTSIRK
ncbi:MAG TPA: universal stress protein [Bacteroidia bacterium]|jgi:nucleotide-binding universal stress UspA family protein|nr:universal stress protein [Bacteroidia bacterium]